jgi:hypothetical protein
MPIPSGLVKLLRARIKRYGTTPGGRIFRTAGAAPSRTPTAAYCGPGSASRRSPRPSAGRRPARRAGHGVAVLLKIYAHCIDGQAGTATKRINGALSAPEAEGLQR